LGNFNIRGRSKYDGSDNNVDRPAMTPGRGNLISQATTRLGFGQVGVGGLRDGNAAIERVLGNLDRPTGSTGAGNVGAMVSATATNGRDAAGQPFLIFPRRWFQHELCGP